MEAGPPRANHLPQILPGALSALSAALFISVGYIDPGKWIACIDSGARFGGELFLFLFLFNLIAILCQYLSAHIAAITGKNLAQICNDEYDKINCVFLGIQAEISIIMSDLSMILGIANALHMMFRVDLFSAVLLTALNSLLFPLFSTWLEDSKANIILSCIAGVTFLCYFLGMLIAQPFISTSSITLPSKLSGENVYALMTLLGANIMPHNFFLHSSIVQRLQGTPGATRTPKAHDHFISIFAVLSGIFLVNYILMNAASTMFYSAGIILPTFQDAMVIMEQSLWSSVGYIVFLLLLSSSHISGLSWEVGGESGQTLLYDFFGVDLPGWLHCATIRIFAVVPALSCLWYSGAEGMYQMLLSTQVMVALMLPPSVIALYRVASSGALMGTYKVSPAVEFVLVMSFMAMIGLQLVFLGEMMFGNDAWSGYLRWNMGSTGLFSPYFILIVIAFVSLCHAFRLFVTPLRSAEQSSVHQSLKWERSQELHASSLKKHDTDTVDTRCSEDTFLERPSLVPSSEEVMETRSDPLDSIDDSDLPDNLMETHQGTCLTPIDEKSPVKESSLEQPAKVTESVFVPEVVHGCSSDVPSVATNETETKATEPVEKTVGVEREPASGKDGEKPEESLKSLGGKLDEGGNGNGSLPRLSGFGRAARRQVVAILDEFWGQLYDYHGQLTQEAKSKKLGLLFSAESNPKPSLTLQEAEAVAKDFTPRFQSDSQSQQRIPSTVGAQKMQMGMYTQDVAAVNAVDHSERRYSSLRLPPSSEGPKPPATMHGYQISSYVNNHAMMDPCADYMGGQRKYATMKIPSSSLAMHDLRDHLSYVYSPKPTNGYGSMQPSSFQSRPVSRNNMFQSDISSMMQPARSSMADRSNVTMQQPDGSNYELFSSAPAEDAKKYHSLPDISGISVPPRDAYLSDKYAQEGNPNTTSGYAGLLPRAAPERPVYSALASRMGPPGFDDLSSRKVRGDAYPSRTYAGLDSGSIWHKQPYEQYGVSNKMSLYVDTGSTGEQQKNVSNEDSASPTVSWEVKLLQSLRDCIVKLLKLEGSEWLFREDDGVDEDLIDRVAAVERFTYEAEFRDKKMMASANESVYGYGGMRPGPGAKAGSRNCGEACVWKADLIVSFGVWCMHRILELSLVETRPELWGKYTYVLNRLQGVIEPAFFKQRTPMMPCLCLKLPTAYQYRLSPVSNGSLPPTAARSPKSKFTTPAMLMEIMDEVEVTICSRRGRSGTPAGDVAFPKGRENLTSAIKRYRRRFSNTPVGGAADAARPGARNPVGP